MFRKSFYYLKTLMQVFRYNIIRIYFHFAYHQVIWSHNGYYLLPRSGFAQKDFDSQVAAKSYEVITEQLDCYSLQKCMVTLLDGFSFAISFSIDDSSSP